MYGNQGFKYMICPYDPNHVIRAFRFPYHIYKCKKNHPDVQLTNCVYNFSHLIKPEDILDHMESCPNRSRNDSNDYDILLEHDSCKKEYSGVGEEELDEFQEPFSELKPLRMRCTREEEKLYYLSLQNTADFECGSRLPDAQEHQPADLPPLQLPKTTSKAFRFKKSAWGDNFKVL